MTPDQFANKSVTQIPLEKRVDTGPLQFGDDWPGYFFRGDEAIGMSNSLRKLADCLEQGDEAITALMPKLMRRLAVQLDAVSQ